MGFRNIRIQPIFETQVETATYRKIGIPPDFSLAERGILVNDLSVGRGNVRDGTLQAVK